MTDVMDLADEGMAPSHAADSETLVQELAEAVRRNAERLGTDVHADLGACWLQYGDALLQLVERGVSGVGDGLGQEDDARDCAELAELEEDLELAWESLETARRCLEMKADDTARESLLRCHLRLADLLSLQGLKEAAMEECRKAVSEGYAQKQEDQVLVSSRMLRLQADLSNWAAAPGITPPADEGRAVQKLPVVSKEEVASSPMEVPVRKRRRVESEHSNQGSRGQTRDHLDEAAQLCQ
ncbi:unnamed protein product, partial [Symbiodinium pilosum]